MEDKNAKQIQTVRLMLRSQPMLLNGRKFAKKQTFTDRQRFTTCQCRLPLGFHNAGNYVPVLVFADFFCKADQQNHVYQYVSFSQHMIPDAIEQCRISSAVLVKKSNRIQINAKHEQIVNLSNKFSKSLTIRKISLFLHFLKLDRNTKIMTACSGLAGNFGHLANFNHSIFDFRGQLHPAAKQRTQGKAGQQTATNWGSCWCFGLLKTSWCNPPTEHRAVITLKSLQHCLKFIGHS